MQISWNQGLLAYDGWNIAKGCPSADVGREFIKFASRADRQAAWTDLAAYGPTNPNSYKDVKPEVADKLATAPAHADLMVMQNAEFWGKNQEAAIERFNKWILD